tara:strand:+ start:505 stop:930 length:426 start_codon:yes stop_codon:yes gene_type:complete
MAKRKSIENKKNPLRLQNILVIFSIVIFGLMLKYLMDLEKKESCECSLTNTRKKLKLVLMIWLVLVFVNMVTKLLTLKVIQVVSFICIIILYMIYENELKKSKCECSDDVRKTLFKYYIYIRLFVLLSVIVFFVLYKDFNK